MRRGDFECADAIARLDELSVLCSENAESSEQDRIDDFIREFNARTGSSATNLEDILNFCDIREDKREISELKDGIAEMKSANRELRKDNRNFESTIQDFHNENQKLLVEVQSTKAENAALREKSASLESLCTDLQHSLDVAKKIPKESLSKSSFERLKALLSSETEQKVIVTKQRDALVALMNKQTQLIGEYEKYSIARKEAPKTLVKVGQNDEITDEDDLLYTTLGGVVHIASRISDINEKVEEIKRSAEMSIGSRITAITSALVEVIERGHRKGVEKTVEVRPAVDEAEKRSMRVLGVMEEELAFLRKLVNSDSLQAMVIGAVSEVDRSVDNAEMKRFLVEHCAKIGHYIEQTMPRISISSTMDELQKTRVDPDAVFELMRPCNVVERIDSVMKTLESPENREVFDLFAAGVIMSSLVHRQLVEVTVKLDRAQNRIHELHALADASTSYRNELKQHEEKEAEVRRIVGRMFDASPKADLADLVSAVIKYFTNEHPEVQKRELKESEKKLRRQNDEKREELVRSHKQEMTVVTDSFKQRQRETRQQLVDARRKAQEKENELHCMNNTVVKQKKRIELLDKKLQEMTGIIDEHSRQKSFSKEVSDAEHSGAIARLKKESETLAFRLSTANEQLLEAQSELTAVKSRNAALKKANEQARTTFSTRMKEQQLAFEKATTDIQNQTAEIRQREQQTQADMRQLSVANTHLKAQNNTIKSESEALKLQQVSYTAKLDQEIARRKTQLDTQRTAMISENERQMAAVRAFCDHLCGIFGCDELVDDQPVVPFEAIIRRATEIVNDRAHYLDESKIIEKLKHVMNVPPSGSVLGVATRLHESHERLIRETERLEVVAAEERAVADSLRQFEQETEERLVSLKQWEIWSRRLLRIRGSAHIESMTHDQTRLLLEETILLGELSGDSLVDKVAILRREKQILAKLVPWKQYHFRGPVAWKSLFIIYRFVGCLTEVSRSVVRRGTDNTPLTTKRPPVSVSPILSPRPTLPGIDPWL